MQKIISPKFDPLSSSPRPWGRLTREQSCQSPCTVHPHARGADALPASPSRLRLGSSPRPWGRLAWAGRPPLRSLVHPHARGADLGLIACVVFDTGSSPRPWGRQNAMAGINLQGRFIPTPVGQTFWGKGFLLPPSVHPHARGADSRKVSTMLL